MHLDKKSMIGIVLALSLPSVAAAQECGGDFTTWRAGVEAEAAARGIGPAGLAALARTSFDQRVVDRDRAQASSPKPFANSRAV